MKLGLYNVTSTIAPIGSAEIGGVERYALNLGIALQERGHQVSLIGGLPPDSMEERIPSLPTHLFPSIDTRNIADLGTRFQRLIQRIHFLESSWDYMIGQSFDTVLIFKPYDFVSAWFWKRNGFKARVVASLHGQEFFGGDRWFSRSLDACYAVSESMARKLAGRYQMPCATIPNFLNPQLFSGLGHRNLSGPLRIVCIGRMVEIKGMEPLLEVFAKVRQRFPSVKLVLIGDGPLRSRVEQRVHELRLDGAVEIPGVLPEDQVMKELGRCHLYVQPSVGEESFSISALEALAMGCNVIASDQVHIAKLFHQLDTAAEIYPARDLEALRLLIEKLLSEAPEQREARGSRAKELAKQHYFADTILPQIEQLCRR